jgi:hypothetical protein
VIDRFERIITKDPVGYWCRIQDEIRLAGPVASLEGK